MPESPVNQPWVQFHQIDPVGLRAALAGSAVIVSCLLNPNIRQR